MKKLRSTTIYLSLLLMGMFITSCEREFDSDADFTLNAPVEVFGDNALLFTKIFQYDNGSAYLWFDIRNEIANFSKPFLGLGFMLDSLERYRRIDLRGMLYEYNENNGELAILRYPLDIVTGGDLPADIVYGFGRKQKEGCELIADAAQRSRCERTFTLTLKRIVFKDIGLTLEADVPAKYQGREIIIHTMQQGMLLAN